MNDSRYLTGREAAEALGVSLPTLYAYVSRGLVRSEPVGGSRRTRRYLAEDVQRLIQRREYRRDPSKVAVESMHWGAPILQTELTDITAEGPAYRGQRAVDLVRTHTIEDVAALLWTGNIDGGADLLWPQNAPVFGQIPELDDTLPDLQRMQVALAFSAAHDLSALDLDVRGTNTVRTAARILRLIAAVLTGGGEADPPIAQLLADRWCPGKAGATRLLDAALILCADHELSVSSFTARVVASGEANLYLVITAALAALQGFKHGGHTELVEALFREVGEPDAARSVIVGRLRRGEQIPGFGHPLYPQGDPRSMALLALVDETYGDAPGRRLAQAIVDVVGEVTGRKPNIDFALVTLARVLDLPQGSALSLFALGRTVGWIGHAVEQYRSGQIIRPRATYVGPRDSTVTHS